MSGRVSQISDLCHGLLNQALIRRQSRSGCSNSEQHATNERERIEIRGFGSFSLHYRAPRIGRNPKTGQSVSLDGKFVPHFKPGKELRDRVNED